MPDTKFDTSALIAWFKDNKRDLPWRLNCSPYQIWVSEIMLQQTQVSVVIPYFERWIHIFPTIKSLAIADIDDVIKAWEGLGYYSRARNLHAGAKYVLENFEGKIPERLEDLIKIPGIGPYTAGAIRSFAFKQKAAAVDGNVIRVLTRYFGIENDISLTKTQKEIWQLADVILPKNKPWLVTEGLIELGALICTKQPKCEVCPLKTCCQSYEKDENGLIRALQLPYKSKKQDVKRIFRAVAVVGCEDFVLIQRGNPGKIMSDLHEFPYWEISENDAMNVKNFNLEEFKARIAMELKIEVMFMEYLPQVSHSFTHFRAVLVPIKFSCKERIGVDKMQWVKKESMANLAFSSGHRRIASLFTE